MPIIKIYRRSFPAPEGKPNPKQLVATFARGAEMEANILYTSLHDRFTVPRDTQDPLVCALRNQLIECQQEFADLLKRLADLREALVKIRDSSPSVAIAEATAKVALGFDDFAAARTQPKP